MTSPDTPTADGPHLYGPKPGSIDFHRKPIDYSAPAPTADGAQWTAHGDGPPVATRKMCASSVRWSDDIWLTWDDIPATAYIENSQRKAAFAALVRDVEAARRVPTLRDRHTATRLYDAVKARRAEHGHRVLTIPEIAAVLQAAADLLTGETDGE